MRHARMVLMGILAAAVPAACGAAGTPAPEAKPAPAAPGPGGDVVIRTLPGIVVDTRAKEVRLAGQVCRQNVALELFVCSEGSREHESVFVVKAKPSHVTFALALLGLAPGKPGFTTEGGAFSPPAGATLDIVVSYTGPDGSKVEAPAWKFLRLAGNDDGLDRALEWVYVGQAGEQALRDADREGTVICLANFLEAVIDVPFESTSVNANLLYQANPKTVPAIGTPVELIIRPTGRRIEPRKVEIEVVLRPGQQPLLDGKPLDLAALKEAVNRMPADIRTAVLRADADEKFGRAMEVHDLLNDALMQVRLTVFRPKPLPAAGQAEAPALDIAVTADDRVRAGGKTWTLQEFQAGAADLLKGVTRVSLTAESKASAKAVAEVMAIVRSLGPAVSLVHASEAKPAPATP